MKEKRDITIFNAHLISAAISTDDTTKDFNVPFSLCQFLNL